MPEQTVRANDLTVDQCGTHLLNRLQDMGTSHREYENDKLILSRLVTLAIVATEQVPDAKDPETETPTPSDDEAKKPPSDEDTGFQNE